MNKFLLGLTAFLMAGSVHAGVYVQGGFGAGAESDRSVSAAIGYQIDFLVKPRVEVEYLYTHANYDGKTDMNSAFANGYLTIPFIPIIDPYVGVGLGRARMNHDDSTAAQGMAGVEFDFPFLPFSVSAEYRYLRLFDRTNNEKKYDDSMFLGRLKYEF